VGHSDAGSVVARHLVEDMLRHPTSLIYQSPSIKRYGLDAWGE
jgi:hypothetical protein